MNTSRDQAGRQASAEPQAAEGRDARGRFAAGNQGGPGNPFARKVAALRAALMNFITEDDMKHIAFVLQMKAEGGNLEAMKLLFQYVIGRPRESVDPDRLGVDEWEKVQEHALHPDEAAQVLHRMPADMAYRLTRIMWPCAVEQNLTAPLLAGIQAMDERDARRAANANQQASGAEGKTAGVKPNARQEKAPTTNGGNGEVDAWLRRLMGGQWGEVEEAPSPNGATAEEATPSVTKRRKRRRRKAKGRHVGSSSSRKSGADR